MWNWKLLYLSIIMWYPCASYIYNTTQMRWVDNLLDVKQRDSFFDRIVMIVLNETIDEDETYMKNHTLIAPAVFISEDLVLTSYNPFRKLITDKHKGRRLVIAWIEYRVVKEFVISYDLGFSTVRCARQVVPAEEMDEKNVWHGQKEDNSPLHDLMVIRVNTSVNFVQNTDFSKYSSTSRIQAGPVLMELAKSDEKFDYDQEIKYASAGYRTNYEIWKWCCLKRTVHNSFPVSRENVRMNCGKWLPKEWGHFICIDNVHDYPGIGSGAMLVNNKKLFGVGSFMIKRGKRSIMVFTDVRAYHHLIFKTCTWVDQDLGVTTTEGSK